MPVIICLFNKDNSLVKGFLIQCKADEAPSLGIESGTRSDSGLSERSPQTWGLPAVKSIPLNRSWIDPPWPIPQKCLVEENTPSPQIPYQKIHPRKYETVSQRMTSLLKPGTECNGKSTYLALFLLTLRKAIHFLPGLLRLTFPAKAEASVSLKGENYVPGSGFDYCG